MGGFWECFIGFTKTAIKKVLGRRHVSLSTLETIIVEIEAILNDHPLTFVNDHPMTILTIQLCKRARIQATVLSDFKKRWCHEYLTSLQEYHKTSGDNQQAVKNGDVIIHNDTARTTWKMVVIDDLIVGRDGLV